MIELSGIISKGLHVIPILIPRDHCFMLAQYVNAYHYIHHYNTMIIYHDFIFNLISRNFHFRSRRDMAFDMRFNLIYVISLS